MKRLKRTNNYAYVSNLTVGKTRNIIAGGRYTENTKKVLQYARVFIFYFFLIYRNGFSYCCYYYFYIKFISINQYTPSPLVTQWDIRVNGKISHKIVCLCKRRTSAKCTNKSKIVNINFHRRRRTANVTDDFIEFNRTSYEHVFIYANK